MTDKQHITQQVSDCFNANNVAFSMADGWTSLIESPYVRLSKLLKDEFHLTQSDVEELVDEMEELIALYVLQTSPKFTGEPEVDPLDEWDRKYEEKVGK